VSAAADHGNGRFTALVLAGSRGPSDPVAASAGLSHKALVPIAGRPMLLRVLDTLRQSPRIGRIAVCLDRPELTAALPELQRLVDGGVILITPAGPTPSRSVLLGLERLGRPLPLLVTTGDHPLLTPAMVEHFLAAATGRGADVAVAVATESVVQRAYPETRRTYVRLADGGVTGCNLFAFLGQDASRAAEFWTKVERYRKQPWRLFAAAGPVSLALFLLGRLDLDQAIARLGRRLGITGLAVRMPFAEAAIDVDKPADRDLAERILGARR
jgi:GTP:adenosylcobinamide-phosphate guanylyltransferase